MASFNWALINFAIKVVLGQSFLKNLYILINFLFKSWESGLFYSWSDGLEFEIEVLHLF